MPNEMPLRFLNAKEGMYLGTMVAEGLARGLTNPVVRKTIVVGSGELKRTVYEDDFLKELRKSQGLFQNTLHEQRGW